MEKNSLLLVDDDPTMRLVLAAALREHGARVTEADGTSMLDNSLVLWGNEIGEGSSHTYKDIPWLLAGSAGKHLKTGQYLAYDNVPHNNLLLSVCHAFGMSEQTSFGAPENCTGPLPGLTA